MTIEEKLKMVELEARVKQLEADSWLIVMIDAIILASLIVLIIIK